MGRAARVLAVGLAALALVACARRSTTLPGFTVRNERALQRMASQDLSCPVASLILTPLAARVVQVIGCGQLREYSIGPDRRNWFALQPVAMRAAVEMACTPAELAIAAPVATTRNVSGCQRTARYDLVCGSVECGWMMTAHGGLWAGEAGAAQTVVTVTGGATDATYVEAATSGSAAATVAPSSEEELAIPEPPAAGSPEELIRAALDGQREAIRRCAGASSSEPQPVAVRAAWAADGAVTLALDAPLAGTPAEGCVRRLFPGHRVAASSAGELVHPVR